MWKKANPTAWADYKLKLKEATKNATYYEPYDEAKCAAIGGVKSAHVVIPTRNV